MQDAAQGPTPGQGGQIGTGVTEAGNGSGMQSQGIRVTEAGNGSGMQSQGIRVTEAGNGSGMQSQGIRVTEAGNGSGMQSQGIRVTEAGNGSGMQSQGIRVTEAGNGSGMQRAQQAAPTVQPTNSTPDLLAPGLAEPLKETGIALEKEIYETLKYVKEAVVATDQR